MNINKYDTERLNKLPILEVTAKLGLNVIHNTMLCFLHSENTPSLKFNIKNNKWKCYGCGEGGGVIDLVIKHTGLIFQDACMWLCDEFGIHTSSKLYGQKAKRQIVKQLPNEKITSYHSDTEVYNWIIENAGISLNAIFYLENARKYPRDIIDKYRIRSTTNNDGLLKRCIDKFGTDRLLNCGVGKIKKTKKGECFLSFVWWDEVLLFPYFNRREEIIYIQARKINTDTQYKYICLNGVETSFYNQDILNHLQDGDDLVICEGVTDCISLGLMGKNSIGIIGANGFKADYAKQFLNFKIIVIPDNDKGAGNRFVKTIQDVFIKYGKSIQIFILDKKYKDISDYYINEYAK